MGFPTSRAQDYILVDGEWVSQWDFVGSLPRKGEFYKLLGGPPDSRSLPLRVPIFYRPRHEPPIPLLARRPVKIISGKHNRRRGQQGVSVQRRLAGRTRGGLPCGAGRREGGYGASGAGGVTLVDAGPRVRIYRPTDLQKPLLHHM